MGLSDILAMLMQHGGGGAPPMMMSPGGGASPPSAAPVSMLPGTDLPTPQPLDHSSNYGLMPQNNGLHALLQQILGQ